MYKRYGNVGFKIGEDDHGKKLRIHLKYYLEYLLHNTDDSPLYLFERYFIIIIIIYSSLEDLKDDGKDIIKRFDIPKYFRDDLFSLVGEKKRPPYRWFLLG
jgi:histone arginine demethylase JMJD6